MPPIPVSEFVSRLPTMMDLLRTMVEMESPSTDKDALDALGKYVGGQMSRLGADVQCRPQLKSGDLWIGQWGTGEGGLLLLTHLDTVFPVGTLSHRPWTEQDGRIFGPGVLDMKASLAMALTAIEVLHQAKRFPDRRVTMLCTSDEETGSHSSRPLIERLAARHHLTLCLEPALPDGSLKTQRKGVGVFHLETRGRSAHAGSDPEEGVNAVLEMAHQLLHVVELADEQSGTTVSPGVVRGGTRSNVIPDTCRARIDVRVSSTEEGERVDQALHGLTPVLPGASVLVEGGLNRPPMPRTQPIAQAFARAQSIALKLGLRLKEGSTGGASDANFIAPLNLPLIDGLGAVGEGAHSEREFVEIQSLPERTALLAALISEW